MESKTEQPATAFRHTLDGEGGGLVETQHSSWATSVEKSASTAVEPAKSSGGGFLSQRLSTGSGGGFQPKGSGGGFFQHRLSNGSGRRLGSKESASADSGGDVGVTKTGSAVGVQKTGSSTMGKLATLGRATEKLKDMTSIHDKQLLKGIPVCKAMGSFGKLFGVGTDPEQNMAMARQVHQLNDFISHNWIIPRLTKWSTLALHYNMVPATVASLVAGAFATALVLAGALPPIGDAIINDADGVKTSTYAYFPWPLFLGIPTFFLTFCFWEDVKRYVPRRFHHKGGLEFGEERMAFVDKSCIHQTDKAQMLAGIRNLAGFLRASDYMVVCCGPTYFRKLWTVYEIASFLSIHQDPSRILLYPTSWAPRLAFFTVFNFIFVLAIYVVLITGMSIGQFLLVVPVLFGVFMVRTLRTGYRAILQIEEDLLNFSIRNAHCAVESDRAVVQGNVSVFMQELGRVAEHAREDECLDSFDEIVREDFLGSILATHSMARNFAMLLQISYIPSGVLSSLNTALSILVSLDSPQQALTFAIGSIDTCFLYLLIINVVADPMLSRQLHLRGWREIAYLLLTTAFFVLFFFAYNAVRGQLFAPALDLRGALAPAERWPRILVLFAWQLLGLLAAWYTTKRPCCPVMLRREGAQPGERPVNRAGISVSV